MSEHEAPTPPTRPVTGATSMNDHRTAAEYFHDRAADTLAAHDKPMAMQRAHYHLLAAFLDGQREQTKALLSILEATNAILAAQESRTGAEAGTDSQDAPETVTGAHSDESDPDTITLTLPHHMVKRLIGSADEVAGIYRKNGSVVEAGLRESAASALESAYFNALDTAGPPQEAEQDVPEGKVLVDRADLRVIVSGDLYTEHAYGSARRRLRAALDGGEGR